MALFLDRIDTIAEPQELNGQLPSWLPVFIDSINETLGKIEGNVPSRETNSSAAFTATPNSSYITMAPGLTSVILPAQCAVKDEIQIIGNSGTGWELLPGIGQTIKVSGSSAATSVASSSQYDCITVVCVVANTTWATTNSQTSGFIIT